MAQPIYKFFMARFLEPWYQLSKEKQDGVVAKLNEALEKVGKQVKGNGRKICCTAPLPGPSQE
jgi:hypothetical protein